MKIVLLGTGGYFPTSRRQTACVMAPDIGVVLDAGSGMCRISKYLQTERLDVFLTHAHLDHIAGLTCLVNAVPAEVLRRTTIHGEASKLAAVREHLFAEAIFPVAPAFRFQTLETISPLPEGGKLTHFPLTHPGGSLGFRLDWSSRSLAYITDTTAAADAAYVEKIRGVDLLVHECYYANDAGNLPALVGHSSLVSVAAVAAAANVGRLVLVHIDPQIDDDRAFDLGAARKIFKDTQIGVDEMELKI